jgi:hypothetical protein
MVKPDEPVLDDARQDARRALRSSVLDSVKKALAIFAGAVTVSAAYGSALVALGTFTFFTLWMLITFALLAGVVSLVVLEFFRLHERSTALRSLLASEKVYESLVRDARRERDQVTEQLSLLHVQLEIARAVRARQEADFARAAIEPELDSPRGDSDE